MDEAAGAEEDEEEAALVLLLRCPSSVFNLQAKAPHHQTQFPAAQAQEKRPTQTRLLLLLSHHRHNSHPIRPSLLRSSSPPPSPSTTSSTASPPASRHPRLTRDLFIVRSRTSYPTQFISLTDLELRPIRCRRSGFPLAGSSPETSLVLKIPSEIERSRVDHRLRQWNRRRRRLTNGSQTPPRRQPRHHLCSLSLISHPSPSTPWNSLPSASSPSPTRMSSPLPPKIQRCHCRSPPSSSPPPSSSRFLLFSSDASSP